MLNFCDFIQVYVFTTNRHLTFGKLRVTKHVTFYISLINWPRGYKTFFMLYSAEHEIAPAPKC